MYESFYRLRELPFKLTPDPAYLYLSRQHRMALAMFRFGLASQAGFCVLSGEVGAGKTLLIRQVLASLKDQVQIGLIANTSARFASLLPWVCQAFGLEAASTERTVVYKAFVDFLHREHAAGRRAVLIVDEAQNLGAEALEELRLLSNVTSDDSIMLQTFLVGQPELRETLALPQLRQLAQRISVDYHLPALAVEDARAYVRHRLAVSGGDPELFTAGAIEVAHHGSGGVPRLINQLCDTALIYGFAEQSERVDAELMAQVIEDRTAGRVFPARRVAGTSAAAVNAALS